MSVPRCVASLAVALLGACLAPIGPRATGIQDPAERERVPAPVGSSRPRPQSQAAAAGPWDPDATPNAMSFGLGGAFWGELGSLSTAGTGLEPAEFGDFDSWGFYVDLGYDRVVGRIGDWPWSLGVEFGIATFANEGDGISPFSDRLDATWIRLMPTARVHVPLGPGVTMVPGVGIGGSYLSIDEYDDIGWGWGATYSSRTLYVVWTLGVLADVAFDFAVLDDYGVLRIDNEFHWADFDGIGGLLPAESRVGGLVYALQIEFVARF